MYPSTLFSIGDEDFVSDKSFSSLGVIGPGTECSLFSSSFLTVVKLICRKIFMRPRMEKIIRRNFLIRIALLSDSGDEAGWELGVLGNISTIIGVFFFFYKRLKHILLIFVWRFRRTTVDDLKAVCVAKMIQWIDCLLR